MEYSKWDGRRHWHFDVDLLGEDSFGTWYGFPAGTLLQRGEEAPIASVGGACLVPREGWWVAHFALAPRPGDAHVYINVTDQPRQSDEGVKAIDLDLDVVGWPDGRVELEDEDEFELHAAQYGYPAGHVETARATAQFLMTAVAAQEEPFRSAYEQWTRRVRYGSPRT